MVGAVASATVTAMAPKTSSAAEQTIHEVSIQSFKFVPDAIQVELGDIIRWTNEDLSPHTATADEYGWDTGKIAKGSSAEISIVEGMETSYFCAFHPHMKGSIEIF